MKDIKAIEITNLSYHYKSNWLFKSMKAINNLSIDVFKGEAFGFLGPNGAGKTTTIKAILGLIKPKKGKIKIFGMDSSFPEARKSVGYLPEQPYFYDHLTVQEIMQMYAALSGIEASNINTFVFEALEKVKISNRAKSLMRTLSKGLMQRVAMAQAIVAKPKILLLDEPFSGLDPIGRKELKDLISELKALGTTILMSSHILGDVEFLCSRASILVKGELKGVYELSNLKNSSATSYELIVNNHEGAESQFVETADSIYKEGKLLRLVFKQKEKADLALKKCMEINIQIESFSPQHESLEEIFVDIVKTNND